jgi:guanylate kinase
MRELYAFVGESGAGKTGMCKLLESQFQIQKIKTHTTRLPREGETDYAFSTKEDFFCDMDNGWVFEHVIIDGNYYWTLKSDYVFEGKRCVSIDPIGADFIKKNADADVHIVYLKVDEKLRSQRIFEENVDTKKFFNYKENYHDLDLESKSRLTRLARDKEAYKWFKCDYVVNNESSICDTIEILKPIMRLAE